MGLFVGGYEGWEHRSIDERCMLAIIVAKSGSQIGLRDENMGAEQMRAYLAAEERSRRGRYEKLQEYRW